MRASISKLAFAVLLASALLAGNAAAAARLKLGGSGGATGTLNRLGSAFVAGGVAAPNRAKIAKKLNVPLIANESLSPGATRDRRLLLNLAFTQSIE
jgi:hypothetical protein